MIAALQPSSRSLACSDAIAGSSGAVSMGTSIIAVSFNGGVILGADSRTSTGSYIANRVADKVRT
jgi:20S proteasome subunit beta 1